MLGSNLNRIAEPNNGFGNITSYIPPSIASQTQPIRQSRPSSGKRRLHKQQLSQSQPVNDSLHRQIVALPLEQAKNVDFVIFQGERATEVRGFSDTV